MRYVLIIPAFTIGCLFGFMLLFLIPLIIYDTLVYGGQAYAHPDALDWLQRPAMLIGGLVGAFGMMVWASQSKDNP
jgi:hypothetical protein